MTAKLLSGAALVVALAGLESPAAESKQTKPQIEVCFVLDTTGSMGGLIEGAKQKIWSIANEMVSAKPTPEIRLGLVAYRDRGDEFVTKTYDLTNDIDAVYANLQKFSAGGGGDTPESVNQALHEAVTRLGWSQDRKVLKIIFLVGDSPPHMDYPNDVKYPEVCQAAVKRDLIINTIQCGNNPETTTIWKKISDLAEGNFVAIPQSGGMVAIATPMDAELADLNRKVGGTLVAYGSASSRATFESRAVTAAAAPAAVAADRSAFMMRAGGGRTYSGEDLVDALAAGTVKLESVKKQDLPEKLQTLDDAALKAEIAKRQKERAELQAQITKLSKEREDYLAKERKRLAASGKADSFDDKVAETIRAQAAKKGISYGK
jgi:hypothetical protein